MHLRTKTHLDIDLLEHAHTTTCIDERYFLWRGDHKRRVELDQLCQAECHIARARRHVDDEHVERLLGRARRAPVHLEQELLRRLLHHQTTPDDGCVGDVAGTRGRREKVAHRHRRYPVIRERQQ
jgi:hypothetical protein